MTSNQRIGRHGFPESIDSVEQIIRMAVAVGDQLRLGRNHLTGRGLAVRSYLQSAAADMDARVKALNPKDTTTQIIQADGDTKPDNNSDEALSCWVLSPCFNRHNFIRRQPTWGVAVGFQHNGVATGGVIYAPHEGLVFSKYEDGKPYVRTLAAMRSDRLDNHPEGLRVLTDFHRVAPQGALLVRTAVEAIADTLPAAAKDRVLGL